jgi:pyruvate, water dikinase
MKKIAQGMGVSRGEAQGRVRIIKNFDDHARFEEGDILVTKITDPKMVLLMGKASGIICDIGGMASHPSILSREMGVPCIVSASCVDTGKPVTEVLEEGSLIIMSGATGEVHKNG